MSRTPWNKGLDQTDRYLKRTIDIVESEAHLQLHEATARRHVKRYLLHKNGHKCEICKTEEWMGTPVPLIIDHIDGDTGNNTVSNFRIVCANCDAQLPTYKSKNKKGRKYDREYYQNTK